MAILKSAFGTSQCKNIPVQGGVVGNIMVFENSFLHSVVQNVTPS